MILWISGTVGETTLTIEQLAAHTHNQHNAQWENGYGGGNGGGQSWSGSKTVATSSTGGSQSHTHTLTNITSGSATSMPPYYVLSFIMRTV